MYLVNELNKFEEFFSLLMVPRYYNITTLLYSAHRQSL